MDKLKDIKLFVEHSEILDELTKLHMKWLIDQVDKLKKENWELNREIGGYSNMLSDIAKVNDELTNQMKHLEKKMLGE